MPEKVPQSLANHTRFDPGFHFFMIPVFSLSWIVSIVLLIRHPSLLAAWEVVFVTAAVLAVLKIRSYALKVQDRVIRVEERLRLGTLLPQSAHAKLAALTEDQLVALRFAGDAELPALAARCAAEKLSRKQVKQAIRIWRPDYWRV